MSQHYTKNTVSVQMYCTKCAKREQHRIDGGRIGPCLGCIARYEQQRIATRDLAEPPAVQLSIYGGQQ